MEIGNGNCCGKILKKNFAENGILKSSVLKFTFTLAWHKCG